MEILAAGISLLLVTCTVALLRGIAALRSSP